MAVTSCAKVTMSSKTALRVIALQPDTEIHAFISQPLQQPKSSKSPTVIFLHFWGGSAATWSFVNPLVSKTYSTVALDFRGWGASTGPDDKTAYSIAALASDVEGVIDALQLKSVVLVGLSMGAKVAQLVASRMCSQSGTTERAAVLQGLVLVSPAPPTPLVLPPEMREQQLHAYDNENSAVFVAKNVLTLTFRTQDLPNFVAMDMLRGNKWAKQAWPAYAMGEDISGAIDKITVPVMVLAAAEDVVEPIGKVQAAMRIHYPGAKVEVLHGSGHLSPLDNSEAVARHLLSFLGTL